VSSSAALTADGTSLVGADDGSVRAISSSGRVLWSLHTGGPIHSSPSIGPSGLVVFGSRDGSVYALK
jgi:outer membrane protein assembly factor BamB